MSLNVRSASFCSRVRLRGVSTLTVTYWSPRPRPLTHGDALAPQTEHGAGLGALRQVVLHLAVDGGDLQLRAQRGLRKGDGRFAEHVVALPAEQLDGAAPSTRDQQIARRCRRCLPALPCPRREMVWPWSIPAGMLTLMVLRLAHAPLPAAVGAGLVDDLAGAAGTWGRGGVLANTPMGVRCCTCTCPLPWQSGQISGVVPGCAAAALAGGALLAALDGDLLFAAEGRLLERDGHAGADALAPLGRVGVPPLLAAECRRRRSCRRCRPDRRSRSRPRRRMRRLRRLRPRRSWGQRPRSRTGRTGPSSPGRTSTSLASLTSLNFSSASLSPGFMSGWYFRASFRYAFLISSSDAPLLTPRTS